MTIYEVRLRAQQGLHLGVGRGTDFGRQTLTYVPSSTLKGALGAAWLRETGRSAEDLVPLLDMVTLSDAVVVPEGSRWAAGAIPLDQGTCKYPIEDKCPPSHPWDAPKCHFCGGTPEQSKGERKLPGGATIENVTRVALDKRERAVDDMLYQREVLEARNLELVALATGDINSLAQRGTAIRIGAATSVAGRAAVTAVDPLRLPPTASTLPLHKGSTTLRVELLTPGVYVDDFGFPSASPDSEWIRTALGLPGTTAVEVVRSFTRWGRSSGWNLAANVPKTEDASVIAHSVFHVLVEVDVHADVPTYIPRLGLRTDEGNGWAQVERLVTNA